MAENAANLPAVIAAPRVKVGDTVRVGSFFWIEDENFIGFDRNADHGQALCPGGSVDENCSVTIRAIEDDYAIVRLNRDAVPYGGLAAIGSVFTIPIATIESWPKMIEAREAREKVRAKMAKKYCK